MKCAKKKKRCAFSKDRACGLWIMDLNASHILLREELVALGFSTLQSHTHCSESWCVYRGECQLLTENSFILLLILYSPVYYLLRPARLWSGRAPRARSTIAPFCVSFPLASLCSSLSLCFSVHPSFSLISVFLVVSFSVPCQLSLTLSPTRCVSTFCSHIRYFLCAM